jgi:tetratricopeptide (TPR) repeat protein
VSGRSRPPDPAALLAEAEALREAGRFAEAADAYAKVAFADPTRPEGYVGAARAQAERGLVDEAFTLLTQAATVAPDFLPTYGLAARIGLHWYDELPRALRLVEAGVLARDDAPEVWAWLGRLQAVLRRVTDLRRTLRRLEQATGRLREDLVRELADDPDLGRDAEAVRALRRAANLTA